MRSWRSTTASRTSAWSASAAAAFLAVAVSFGTVFRLRRLSAWTLLAGGPIYAVYIAAALLLLVIVLALVSRSLVRRATPLKPEQAIAEASLTRRMLRGPHAD